MTDTPTSEPESEPDQPRPFQFSIAALMILTAAVAGFLALATQLPFIFAAGYVHLVLLMLALRYRTQALGILAMNYTIFNIYFLPVIVFVYVKNIVISTLSVFLLPVSLLAAFLYSTILLFRGPRFNRISGGICVVINVLIIGLLIFVVFVVYIFYESGWRFKIP